MVTKRHDIVTDSIHERYNIAATRDAPHRTALQKVAGRNSQDISCISNCIAKTRKFCIAVHIAMDIVFVNDNDAPRQSQSIRTTFNLRLFP